MSVTRLHLAGQSGAFAPVVICNVRFEQSQLIVGPDVFFEQNSLFIRECLMPNVEIGADEIVFRYFVFGGIPVFGLITAATSAEPDSRRAGHPIFWGVAARVSKKNTYENANRILRFMGHFLVRYFPKIAGLDVADAIQDYLSKDPSDQHTKLFDELERDLSSFIELFNIRRNEKSENLIERLMRKLYQFKKMALPPTFARLSDSGDAALIAFFLELWKIHGFPSNFSAHHTRGDSGKTIVMVKTDQSPLVTIRTHDFSDSV